MTAETAQLVEQFKALVSTTGAIFYEAKDALDAREYILKLAQERNVKNVVKSKSSIADDIGLRELLEKAGVKTTEADIGEWIRQLAGTKPITDKDIKKTADLISRATGETIEPKPEAIVNTAQRILRELYINADLGISEADVAIAETGTLVLIGNEGNTRLVAVLPRYHLTLLDSRNLVATLDDASARIRASSKKQASHKMPAYVTYLTGRNTTADIPGAIFARAQGPAEEHIVLVNKAAGRRGAA